MGADGTDGSLLTAVHTVQCVCMQREAGGKESQGDKNLSRMLLCVSRII